MSQFRIYLLHFQSVIDVDAPDSGKDFFISLNHTRLLEEEIGEIAWDLNDMRQMFSGRELIVRTLQFDPDATDEAIVGQASDLIKTRPIQDFAIMVACGNVSLIEIGMILSRTDVEPWGEIFGDTLEPETGEISIWWYSDKNKGENIMKTNLHIKDILDSALENRQCIALRGLPGSGKTAISMAWAEEHKNRIHAVWLDGAELNMRQLSENTHVKNGLTLSGQLFTEEEIRLMQQPDTVIFVDNFHLLSQTVVRHVELLADRYAISETRPEEFVSLENVSFVCVIETAIESPEEYEKNG